MAPLPQQPTHHSFYTQELVGDRAASQIFLLFRYSQVFALPWDHVFRIDTHEYTWVFRPKWCEKCACFTYTMYASGELAGFWKDEATYRFAPRHLCRVILALHHMCMTYVLAQTATQVQRKAEHERSVERVHMERQVLVDARHPLVAPLYAAFQDRLYLYLEMEYCPGGSLDNFLRHACYY